MIYEACLASRKDPRGEWLNPPGVVVELQGTGKKVPRKDGANQDGADAGIPWTLRAHKSAIPGSTYARSPIGG